MKLDIQNTLTILFRPLLLFIFSVILLHGIPQAAELTTSLDSSKPVTIKAAYATYIDEDKTAYARGKVRVTYGLDTLYADEIWFTSPTRFLHAKGHVKLTRGTYGKTTVNQLNCDDLKYEIDTYRGTATKVYSVVPPWFIHAPEIEQLNKFEQYVQHPSFTTCDRPEPHYHLAARELVIYPEKYLIARDVVFYFKNIPLFYYPIYRRGLIKHEASFQLTPGHNSYLGMFVKSSYKFFWSDEITTRILLDYYSKQGFGTGLELEYTIASTHQGRLATYYIDEKESDRQRDRIYLRHRSDFTDKISALAYVNYASDPEFDQDYVWRYIRGILDTRESFLSFQNLDDNYAVRLTLHRLDEAMQNETGTKEFLMTEEQLPQLEFNTKYHRLGSIPAYLLWQSSIAQTRQPGLDFFSSQDNYAATEAQAESEIITSFPITDQITFTPSLGIENDWSSETIGTAIYDEFQSRLYGETRFQFRNNNYMKTDIFWRGVYRLDNPEDDERDRLETNLLGSRITYRFPRTKLRLIWSSAYSLKDEQDAADDELRYSTRLDASWQIKNSLTFFASGELLNQYMNDSVGNQEDVTGQTWYASLNYHPKNWWWVSLGTKYQKVKYANETLGMSTESIALYPAIGTNLGSKWKLQASAGYELGKAENAEQTTESIYRQILLIRDLHCWEAYLRYQTWHDGSSWFFAFNLKAFPIQYLQFNDKTGLF